MTSRAAALLAHALAHRIAIKIRVEQEPGAVLHLRLQQGEETTSWAQAIEPGQTPADAIELLFGEVLATLPGQGGHASSVDIAA